MATIIFDMDGTISDSFDYVSEFLAREANVWPLSGIQKRDLRGISMTSMARQLGYPWWRLPVLFYRGRSRMGQEIKGLQAFDGMPDIIEKLYDEGHELFIVSANSSSNIHGFLRAQKLDTYFVEVYGNAGVLGKASVLRRLLRQQKLHVDQAIYVGDELRDVQAAQSIHLRIVAVTWGFARRETLVAQKPTALADTPDELMKTLEEI